MGNQTEFNGLLLIDKHSDITSFGIISRLRALTGIKKIGHCGTLDPFATGLLPILFGRYTKLARYLEAVDKTYQVKMVLGSATNTMDLTGEITHRSDPDQLSQRIKSDELAQTLQEILKNEFMGEIEQLPPMYSAVKVAGQPLYKYARQGKVVERKPRMVTIYQADLSPIYMEDQEWVCEARIRCSKGTYIRTLVHDLGKQAECFAYVKSLRRLECGNLSLGENSYQLNALFTLFAELKEDQALLRQEIETKYFFPIKHALDEIPTYSLNQDQAQKVIYGQPLQLTNLNPLSSAATFQLLYNDKLLAIVSFDPTESEFIKYERVLADRI